MSSAPASASALAADLLSRTSDAAYVAAHKKELAKEFTSTIKALEAEQPADAALIQACKDKFKEITAPSADKAAKAKEKEAAKLAKKAAEAAAAAAGPAAAVAAPAAAAAPVAAAAKAQPTAALATDGAAAPVSTLRSGDYQVRIQSTPRASASALSCSCCVCS